MLRCFDRDAVVAADDIAVVVGVPADESRALERPEHRRGNETLAVAGQASARHWRSTLVRAG
jgi:hypothetical protein